MEAWLWGALKWSWTAVFIPIAWWIAKRHIDDIDSLHKGQKSLSDAMETLEKKLIGEHMTREQTEELVGKTESAIAELHRKIETTGTGLGNKIDINHRQVMNALLAKGRGHYEE